MRCTKRQKLDQTEGPIESDFEPGQEHAAHSPDDLVEMHPQRPWLFKGLGADLGLVVNLTNKDPYSYLRDNVSEGSFRVFNKDDQVERLTLSEFLNRSEQGEFAYMETSSWDPSPPSPGIARRGDHLLDRLPPHDLAPRPLSRACASDRLMKARCYLRLSAAEQPMIVGWHYDGFDQVILNALGAAAKAFELAPPATEALISGWLRPGEEPPPGAAARVELAPGDVLYLPARWCHRVVTAARSMTVNWAFYAAAPPPASDANGAPSAAALPPPRPP